VRRPADQVRAEEGQHGQEPLSGRMRRHPTEGRSLGGGKSDLKIRFSIKC